ESRGHQCRFPVPRDAGDAYLRRIDARIRIGFEIVDELADAPAPGAQRAPVVRLAGLPFVGQADNAFAQPAVVRLYAVGNDRAVSPALVERLLRPRLGAIRGTGLVLFGRLWLGRADAARRASEAELKDDRELARGVLGHREVSLNIDFDLGK